MSMFEIRFRLKQHLHLYGLNLMMKYLPQLFNMICAVLKSICNNKQYKKACLNISLFY